MHDIIINYYVLYASMVYQSNIVLWLTPIMYCDID